MTPHHYSVNYYWGGKASCFLTLDKASAEAYAAKHNGVIVEWFEPEPKLVKPIEVLNDDEGQ